MKTKTCKKPVFEPFDRMYGLELELLDSEGFRCPVENAPFPADCTLEELLEQKDELENSIYDWQLIIYIEIDSGNKDDSMIKRANQTIGQLRAELHAIKKQIRSLNKSEREDIAA